MAVIKDEAYGHGLIPIANYLQDKVDWFCVADVEEGVRLRQEGIETPVLVFEIPRIGKEKLYTEHHLTASISDLSVFGRLEDNTECHLHFDTGMMRLGMLPSEASKAVELMNHHNRLNYTGIYTHFANADGPSFPLVEDQISVFSEIRSQFPPHLMTHTSNSAGTLFHQGKALFDAVRTGIALYGYSPGLHEVNGLKPVLEWRSELVQVKAIKKGEAVGYGSRWKSPKNGWLGVIPVGYAEGISRTLSGKFEVEIEDRFYPQVGTISMDYITVFLGNDKLEAGMEVKIIGEGKFSAKEWAEKSGTIPYEVTTRLSQKIDRKYLL